ncbi:barstar family protein [Nocardia mexicana]|nr:barstar family protein [Nocardia mexicana]
MTLSQFLSGAEAAPAAGETRPVPGPALGSLAVGDGEFSSVRYQAPADYVVRELRGSKMRTTAGVFDEFAAAFQFPYYFGENKDAFDECLRDLSDFVGEAPGYVAVIRDSDQLLADQPNQLEWFTEAMRDAAVTWSSYGTTYRVVLQGKPPLDAAPLTL